MGLPTVLAEWFRFELSQITSGEQRLSDAAGATSLVPDAALPASLATITGRAGPPTPSGTPTRAMPTPPSEPLSESPTSPPPAPAPAGILATPGVQLQGENPVELLQRCAEIPLTEVEQRCLYALGALTEAPGAREALANLGFVCRRATVIAVR